MRARIRYQQVYIKLILYDISPRGELKLEFSSANSNANIRIAVANRIYKQETRQKGSNESSIQDFSFKIQAMG